MISENSFYRIWEVNMLYCSNAALESNNECIGKGEGEKRGEK